MTAELIERCKEVLLLDEKRTQGEWSHNPSDADYDWTVDSEISSICMTDCPADMAEANAEFLAAAPTIAALLRECVERIQADQKDAQRYRWLRDNKHLDIWWSVAGPKDRCENIDADIDAAILNNSETKE